LLGLGGTFGLLARREGESLTELSEKSQMMQMMSKTPLTFTPATESRGLRYDTLALVSVGAGVVALAAGAIIYFTTGRRTSTETALSGAPGGASLRLQF
jgi:hypothetical protein